MVRTSRNGGKIAAIIVAGGSGKRMGGIDKLAADLRGKPVLARTLQAFQDCESVDHVVLVVNKDRAEWYGEIVANGNFSKVRSICAGGPRRQDSVAKGLLALDQCSHVIVHDAARPFVTPEMIENAIEAVGETGIAIAAVPVTDTIKMAHDSGVVASTLPRHKLWSVQTPQIFNVEILKKAHETIKDDVTDDASMAEQLGHKVKLFTGSYENIKITTPIDLDVANAIWRHRELSRKQYALSGKSLDQ